MKLPEARNQTGSDENDRGFFPASFYFRTSTDLMPPPFDWIDIPAGRVMLEHGHGRFDVASFTIAKYPVTVGQYEIFIEDGGYQTPDWWTESSWEWLQGEGYTFPRYWNDTNWHSLWKPDHPVVGISWFEAYAFTQWLSNKSGENIHLLTEQQWQRAAQGNDHRMFPWGNKWDKTRCHRLNYSDYRKANRIVVTSTSPVDKYEGRGDSPYGVVDMAGNVWEWTLSAYETAQEVNPDDTDTLRVVRGGSWYYFDAGGFRVADRNWFAPEYRNHILGLRLGRSKAS